MIEYTEEKIDDVVSRIEQDPYDLDWEEIRVLLWLVCKLWRERKLS